MQYARPLSERLGFAVKGDAQSCAFVISLFFLSAPFTVIREISQFVIYTLQRQARWGLPHIGIKVFKGLPSVTHGNASPTVALKVSGVRILTAIFHSAPNAIRACMCHSVALVFPTALRRTFFLQTAATLTAPIVHAAQVTTTDSFDGRADTFAPPLSLMARIATRVTKHSQAVKHATLNVDKTTISWFRSKFNGILVVSHLANSLLVRNLARLVRVSLTPLRAVFNYTTKCLNGVEVLCPKDNKVIPPIKWSRELNLANFQKAYGR